MQTRTIYSDQNSFANKKNTIVNHVLEGRRTGQPNTYDSRELGYLFIGILPTASDETYILSNKENV